MEKPQGLVDFLYALMRDYLPAGEVERLVRDHVEKAADQESIYSNGHLASYAAELAERILNPKERA